jgi:hypothetical protein
MLNTFDPLNPPGIPVPVATTVKRVRKAPVFTFGKGEDGYTRGFNMYDETGHRLCHVTSSIGHCCAASTIGALSMYGFWNNTKKVDSFVKFFRKQWKEQALMRDKDGGAQHIFVVSGFYVLLSVETAGFDKALRNHPNIQKVHSFKNKRGGPRDDYTFNHTIDLYFLEF